MTDLIDCVLHLQRHRENQNWFAAPRHALLLHPCQTPQGAPLLLQFLLLFLLPLLCQLGASAFVVTHLAAVRAGSLLRFLVHCLGDPFLEA